MKARIEPLELDTRGIEITSESSEEKAFLENMFIVGVHAAMISRRDDGTACLIIATSPPGGEPGE